MWYNEYIEELSHELGELLGQRKWKLSTAESLTAGLVADITVESSGASKYFAGGVIAYLNSVKTRILDVEQTLLFTEGAVHKDVAYQMALGVKKLLGTECAISTTGFAGPQSAMKEVVGLVYLCASTPERTIVEEHRYCTENPDQELSRTEIRELAASDAVKLMIKILR